MMFDKFKLIPYFVNKFNIYIYIYLYGIPLIARIYRNVYLVKI